jgi:hypothetical protein
MAFRDDPVARRAYLALQMLLADPLSPMADFLWADVQAASDDAVWKKIDREIAEQWIADGLDDFFGLTVD